MATIVDKTMTIVPITGMYAIPGAYNNTNPVFTDEEGNAYYAEKWGDSTDGWVIAPRSRKLFFHKPLVEQAALHIGGDTGTIVNVAAAFPQDNIPLMVSDACKIELSAF